MFSRYLPSDRLTNVNVPESWVSPRRVLLVARSTNSNFAPGTILPEGSRTVTVTVPSEPCCAREAGTEMIQLTRASVTKRVEAADLRDIRPPRENVIPGGVSGQNSRPIRDNRNTYSDKFRLVGFCIQYAEWLSSTFLCTDGKAREDRFGLCVPRARNLAFNPNLCIFAAEEPDP